MSFLEERQQRSLLHVAEAFRYAHSPLLLL
jgi:hypothetical protein